MHGTGILEVALLLAGVVVILYLKVVRPHRADLEWKRQGERIEAHRARRLGRQRPS